MRKLQALILLPIIIFSCRDDDGPVRTVFSVSQSDIPDEVIVWVIVRNGESGELIDAKQVGSSKLDFETNKVKDGQKLSVSIVAISTWDVSDARVTIFNGVDVGSSWTLSESDEQVIGYKCPQPGTYSLTINNVPSLYAYGLSDKYGERTYGTFFENNAITCKYAEFCDSPQLVTIDPGNGIEPRYTFIENLGAGMPDVNLNYNDFKKFDKYLKFTFPSTQHLYALVTTYEGDDPNDRSYVLYDNLLWGYERKQASQINFGFLDRFARYRVQIDMQWYHFKSYGRPPESIEYAGPEDFTITDRSVNNYAFTTSKEITYTLVRYLYSPSSGDPAGPSLFYDYFDPPGHTKHFDALTPELIDKYNLPVDKIKYDHSTFYLRYPYSDLIKSGFDPEAARRQDYQAAWVNAN